MKTILSLTPLAPVDKKPAKNRFRGPAGAFNCLIRRRQRRIAGGVGGKFNSLLRNELQSLLPFSYCIKRAAWVIALATALPLGAAPSGMPLAPFTYTQDATLTGQRYIGQRKRAVCKDFLDYLNHPRTNELFKPDGTLAHESEKFKSVSWEALDKEKYRDGFNLIVDASHPNSRAEYLRRYADPEWVLQRTMAHPYESAPKPQQRERWLYRLVQQRPKTRNYANPASKIELPAWFHFNSDQWLGDVHGMPQVNDVHVLLGRAGAPQWITYAEATYAVSNSTYGDGKGTVPQYLGVDVHELNVDGDGRSFLHWICAYHAKNTQ